MFQGPPCRPPLSLTLQIQDFGGRRRPFVELKVGWRAACAAVASCGRSGSPNSLLPDPILQHRPDGLGIGRQPRGDLRQRGGTSGDEVALDVHQHCWCGCSGAEWRAHMIGMTASGSALHVPGTMTARGTSGRPPTYRMIPRTPAITRTVATIQNADAAGSRPNRAAW